MRNAFRPLIFALALLLLGGMAAFSSLWIHHKSRVAAGVERTGWQSRFQALTDSSAKLPINWNEQEWLNAGFIMGGRLRLLQVNDTRQPGEIVLNVDGQSGLRAAFVPAEGLTAATRYKLLQHAFLWLLGTAFVSLVMVALVPSRPSARDDQSQHPIHHEIRNVERLARTTVTQAEALAREREARHQNEQTLHLQQLLINRSLEEKIRLGRDLHDGLIQSLYATGLALEAAKGQAHKDPAKAVQLIERCIGTLNTTIKEVRREIENLTPEKVHRSDFKTAVETVLDMTGARESAEIDLRIPGEIAALIRPETQNELLQITRETISNALRHGAAETIELRLETDGDQLCLAIRDDGAGFKLEDLKHRGHGLSNLEARAAAIGGSLRVDSTPGSGTRIIITFPNHPIPTA